MHKNKIARVQAGKNGGVEIVVQLTPTIIATAEELAERLQVGREEVLTTFFADWIDCIPDALRDFIPGGWVFPTRETAEAFIKREQLDSRQYIAEQYESDPRRRIDRPYEDGGWGITDTAEYVVEYPRQHAVAV